MKNHFRMVELKKFTKYTLRICCGYAIIMRDVSFCIYITKYERMCQL